MTTEPIAAGDLTFGAALGELEQIVRALESGQLELEESLERYERGVALLRSCQAKLAEAEQRVTVLMGELEPIGAASDPAPSGPAEGDAS